MAWHPRRIADLGAQYYKMTQAARMISGEYVKHMPVGGAVEWLVVEYQDMPKSMELQAIELQVNTSGPVLFAQLSEFETVPSQYRNGKRQGDPAYGSKFVVRGITYQAKNVEPHHRGGVTISLNKDECCTVADPAFFEELKDFQCLPERGCGG